MSFEKLNLIKPLQDALVNEGYKIPTPIQEKAIPVILERKDLLGCAQTGTGKTAAFALPILQILSEEKQSMRPDELQKASGQKQHNKKQRKNIKALILAPTRELAIQVDESFKTYGKNTGLKSTVVYGGVSQHSQVEKLKKGIDILIATPGRLLDLMYQNHISLSHIQLFVLDEADRMLDMGFINDVKKIISKLPQQRQTLFFSATMPSEIINLSRNILNNPVKIEISPEVKTVEAIKQAVYFVSKSDKKKLLIHLLKNEEVESALVFTRTKRGADIVTRFLNDAKINTEAIHGNKSQNARQKALQNFKTQKSRVLVATDIASRGIDIDNLSHVVNYDIPEYSELYIHRIGRTGRAGLTGTALSFCDIDEWSSMRDINRLIKTPVPVIEDHPFKLAGNITGETKEIVTTTRKKSWGDRRSSRFSGKRRRWGKSQSA